MYTDSVIFSACKGYSTVAYQYNSNLCHMKLYEVINMQVINLGFGNFHKHSRIYNNFVGFFLPACGLLKDHPMIQSSMFTGHYSVGSGSIPVYCKTYVSFHGGLTQIH